MSRRGFTLLEVMVATVVMGLAVVGLLSGISQSLRNAARVSDYDRAALAARSTMDDLLLNNRLPRFQTVTGEFDPLLLGGREGGWKARLTPFEVHPPPMPGAEMLERIQLEIWWKNADGTLRTFQLEGFRKNVVRPQDLAGLAAGVTP